MTLKIDTPVTITGQPGYQNKWPRFYKSFHGLAGEVRQIHKTNENLIEVKLKIFDIPIWVQRNWVTAAQ